MKLEYASTERVSAFIQGLSDQPLKDIYWRGARLWLDTGDGELHLTFGPPEDRDAHAEMVDAPAAGSWVWVELGADKAKDHPFEDGYWVDDWPPVAERTRDYLGSVAQHIASHLSARAVSAVVNS